MRFTDWYAKQPRGTAMRLVREAKVGYFTVQRLREGEPLKLYDVAKRISDATGGAVSIEELCAPRDDAARASSSRDVPSEPPPAQGDAA